MVGGLSSVMLMPAGKNPPVVVIHGTQTDALPSSYRRYLEKIFRRELALHGTPIRIELRSGSNPYSGKRNKLTQRQVQRRQRMMSHIKKSEKKGAAEKARPLIVTPSPASRCRSLVESPRSNVGGSLGRLR